jgi:hypothetical protein
MMMQLTRRLLLLRATQTTRWIHQKFQQLLLPRPQRRR